MKRKKKEKSTRRIFDPGGTLVGLLDRMGELICLNAVFLVCCIPVVTVIPACTSLYYATMKSIRKRRGYPVAEFWSSMKRTAKRGILLTVLVAAWTALLLFGRAQAAKGQGAVQLAPGVLTYDIFLLASVGVWNYLIPVFSRFEMKLAGMLRLALVMSIRFLPFTVLLVAGDAAVGWAMIYLLPIPCILFVPGLWCLAQTWLVERALKAYTPKAPEGEEQWYD